MNINAEKLPLSMVCLMQCEQAVTLALMFRQPQLKKIQMIGGNLDAVHDDVPSQSTELQVTIFDRNIEQCENLFLSGCHFNSLWENSPLVSGKSFFNKVVLVVYC